MAEPNPGTDPVLLQKEPHLRDYLRVLSTRRWILIGTVVLVVLGALVAVLTQTPMYRSQCRLLLEPTRSSVTSIKEVYDPTFGAAAGGALLRRQFLETQYKLILSEPILEDTFHAMGFGDLPEFSDMAEPMRKFAKLFSVSGARNTLLADVTFEWRDPQVAHDTLDYLVQQYIQSCRQRGMGVTEGGLAALRRKRDELRPKLRARSEEFQAFMTEHNMVSLEESQDIVVERLKELSRNLTRTEALRIEAESRYENIRDTLAERRAPEEMPEVKDSETVRDLKLEYIRMKVLCSDLSGSLGPNHPEVKAGESTLRTIAEKLEIEVRSVLSSAKAEYSRVQQQEEELRAALARQAKDVMEFNRLSADYKILKEEHARLHKTYSDVTQRIEEIEISMSAGSAEDGVFVNEPPDVPIKPAKPRKLFTMAVAGILSVLLGVGLSFFVDYLDTSIKSKQDAEEVLGAPVLGYVPSIENGQLTGESASGPLELLAVAKPRSAVAETFRSIRTALSFTHTGPKCQQFVVTSALPTEGKTLVSVNIALALAQIGKRVLLIDSDLRRPRIHKIFQLDSAPGFSNLLAGHDDLSVEDVVRREVSKGLAIIPSGPLPPNPAELLSSPRMGELITALSARFDYVVYDMPPAVNVTDAVVLARQVHGALLVVRSFVTDRAAATRARELLSGAGARVLGVILNGVDAPRSGYRYHQDYYYYYHDKHYDADSEGSS